MSIILANETGTIPEIGFDLRMKEEKVTHDGWEIKGWVNIYELLPYTHERVDGKIMIDIKAYEDKLPEDYSITLQDINFHYGVKDTFILQNLVDYCFLDCEQYFDTIWGIRDVSVYTHKRGFGESVVYKYPEVFSFFKYRGLFYCINITYPDTMPVELLTRARTVCESCYERIPEDIARSYQTSFTCIDSFTQNEVREFMHARPFWVHPSDTMSRYPIFDNYYEGNEYVVLSRSPLYALWKGFGDVSGKQGMIVYEYNRNQCDLKPDQQIFVYWWPTHKWKEKDTTTCIPGDSFELIPEIPSFMWFSYNSFWWGGDRFRKENDELSDSTYTDVFKGLPAYVKLQKIYTYEYSNNFKDRKKNVCYRTDICFSRKETQYQIITLSPSQPIFHKPTDTSWQWFENHWYWLDESHSDWSNYPISWEKMWDPLTPYPYGKE